MTDERKLFFCRKISLSKNIVLRTLMCLPGPFSHYMFLRSKYGVRPTSTGDSIKDAVTRVYGIIRCIFVVFIVDFDLF